MAKHTKKRARSLNCAMCGCAFVSGSSIQIHCSLKCRMLEKMRPHIGQSGCWEWTGSINPVTGYGQLSAWVDGKRTLFTAHRAAYLAVHALIPDGMHILHSCDNRACFNPSHLRAGSHRENMGDMISKGRQLEALKIRKRGPEHHFWGGTHPLLRRGESHYSARLVEDDIRSIRASTKTLKELSKIYGITESSLSAIRRMRTWRHVV